MTTRTLTLAKEGRKYLFRYAAGCEDQVVDEVMRLAQDSDCALDWMDAAMLSFQVTQCAADECCQTFESTQKHQD